MEVDMELTTEQMQRYENYLKLQKVGFYTIFDKYYNAKEGCYQSCARVWNPFTKKETIYNTNDIEDIRQMYEDRHKLYLQLI